MNKLDALWKLLWAENYLVLTGKGALVASYPKNINHFLLIKNIAEEIEKSSKVEQDKPKEMMK